MNDDSDHDGCDSLLEHGSCVEFKVESLGAVELGSLLVLPPTVNTAAEIAFVYPVLEKQTIRRLKPTWLRLRVKVGPACSPNNPVYLMRFTNTFADTFVDYVLLNNVGIYVFIYTRRVNGTDTSRLNQHSL